tara:strand:+ start:20 stop:478 length:459 start_codon:yes stop_codon:yes gene_type:complete
MSKINHTIIDSEYFCENDTHYRVKVVRRTKCFVWVHYIHQTPPDDFYGDFPADYALQEKREILNILNREGEEYKNKLGDKEVEKIDEPNYLEFLKKKIIKSKCEECEGKIIEHIEINSDMRDDNNEKIIHYFSINNYGKSPTIPLSFGRILN